MEVIDLFERATAWTETKVGGSRGCLEVATPCDEWNVSRLLDHLLDGQALFAAGPAGATVAPPTGAPPRLVGADPVAQYEQARQATVSAYSQPGVLAGMLKTPGGEMPAAQFLGIAFCDQLIHGWDLAKASGQDATMPPDLAAIAWQMLSGRISDDTRGPGKSFKAAIPMPEGSSHQDLLLGYSGRMP